MVEVNGQKFEDWNALKAYAEEMHQKELKEKEEAEARAEEERKIAELQELLYKHLSVASVQLADGRTYFVCTLAEGDDKDVYPLAYTEHLFGKRYTITSKGVTVNYTVTRVSKPLVSLKNFLFGHYTSESKERCICWNDVELGGSTYTGVLLRDFIKASEGESYDETEAWLREMFGNVLGIFAR